MSILETQIRTVDINGQPTNTILATSNEIEVSKITRDAFYSFTFSTPVSVIPETQQYAIVLLRNDDYYSDPEIVGWVYSNLSNPYENGSKWEYDGSSWNEITDVDQYFKVFYNAPQVATTKEHVWTFNQNYANKFFVSTDNTMELDMRFHLSFCIDASGSMNWSDPQSLRISETLLFIRELMRRSPFSYVDIWSFTNYLTENTYNGPTRNRMEYSAALGSIDSDGVQSRLWSASEQAIGNLDSSSIVNAIIRDSYIDTVLDLMRQMNRINYQAMHTINSNYDPTTGFSTINKYGDIVDYIVNDYAYTMGRIGIIISDGYDNDDIDNYDINDIILTANAIREDYWTPIYCFALGSNYKNEKMYQICQDTGGIFYQLGEETNTKFREAFNELLNNKEETIFKGIYEEEVWFDEITFLSAIELGAIIPVTSDLQFEISLSYNGINFEDWQIIPTNTLYMLEKFIMAFKIKITGWLGNIYGGNYYDIYGDIENDPTIQDEFTIICKYANYYNYDNYQYYLTSDNYYYRSTDYPSPKIYSLKYWTIDPSITYKFTKPQSSPVISEYLLSPNIDLPKNTILNWGIVRGDSTDPIDLEPIIVNRMGILSNRKISLYYTPDIHQIGLSTVPASQTSNGVIIHRVIDSNSNTVLWSDNDIVTVKINGYEIDPDIISYQLIGEQGLIQWFGTPRPVTDVVTVDITTPGSSHLRAGELTTTTNRRIYYANKSWPWDATAIVRINDKIVNSGFILYPEDGSIFFLKELQPNDIVTIEIQHNSVYRIGYEIKSYTDEEINNPDFGFMFSKEAETETSLLASITAPPIASNVVLSPLNPNLIDRLIVTYDFYQEDNNSEAGTTIEWYVKRYGALSFIHYEDYDNRNVMRTSDVPANNPTGPFQKFDSWYVIVTPKDINSTGVPVQSNTIIIGGYIPPYINTTNATIIAKTGDPTLTRDNNSILNATKQILVASYEYYDPNTGDNSSDASIISWYKNGESQSTYTSVYPDIELPVSYIKSGQVWYYIVRPYDGNNYGYDVQSEEVIITQEKS